MKSILNSPDNEGRNDNGGKFGGSRFAVSAADKFPLHSVQNRTVAVQYNADGAKEAEDAFGEFVKTHFYVPSLGFGFGLVWTLRKAHPAHGMVVINPHIRRINQFRDLSPQLDKI